MRHVQYYAGSYGYCPTKRTQAYHAISPDHPYEVWFTGSKVSPKRRYVQILKYVAEHDGCKRGDIITNVLGKNYSERDPWAPKASKYRGYWSNGFSNLLFMDVLDYDKQFHYHITANGRALLAKVEAM